MLIRFMLPDSRGFPLSAGARGFLFLGCRSKKTARRRRREKGELQRRSVLFNDVHKRLHAVNVDRFVKIPIIFEGRPDNGAVG